MADFYLNDRSLAAYVEKDWADHFAEDMKFAFAPYETSHLYSDYHERSVELLAQVLRKSGVEPLNMLEVGSSLGRTFFEICRKVSSVKSATLLEPSQNLASTFNKIFLDPGDHRFPILKGNVQMSERRLPIEDIRAACRDVEFTCLNSTFQEARLSSGAFDLVICSNVIDQCKDPELLVKFLKASLAAGGTLLLSCTYQWQNKYIGNASKQIMNIHDLFGAEWRSLAEANIPFSVRVFERHWLSFLSHVIVFQKI